MLALSAHDCKAKLGESVVVGMQVYNGLDFDDAMRTARRADGEEIVFTRQERAILLQFTRKPGTLFTRHQLHRALADTGRQTSERNVDFLVARLRTRLGDNAKSPRFIATQYGEGYVWIAQIERRQQFRAFIAIGPVQGGETNAVSLLVKELCAELAALVGPGRNVVIADLPYDQHSGVDYGLEVSLHAEGGTLHGAFVLRSIGERRVIATRRLVAMPEDARQHGRDLAGWVRDALWRYFALPDAAALLTPTDTPVEIRLNEAARALTRSPERWRESEAQLRRARTDRPDDPTLAIMWAMNLYARLIHWPPDPALLIPAGRAEIEGEIEALVLDHLPAIDDNILLKLASAKLLFFVNRGHFDLADRLADEAFAGSTAFGAAFATRGQMLMCKGQFTEACLLYDRGVALAEFGSDFHIYLLVLKCTAQMGADDRAGVARTADELYLVRPPTRWMGLFFLSPYDDALPPDIAQILATFSPERGHETLTHLYHTSARHFRHATHSANVMRGPVYHFRRLLGAEAVPNEVAQLLADAGRQRGRTAPKALREATAMGLA